MFTVDKTETFVLYTLQIFIMPKLQHFCTGIVVGLATLQNVAGNKKCKRWIKTETFVHCKYIGH